MFEWHVEDMALMNQQGVAFIGRKKIYDCEYETSRAEKIAFVDDFQDGKLSYLLALISQFDNECVDLPKDKFGNIRTVSLKAWVKRNDTKYDKPLIDDWFEYGKFTLLGCTRKIQNPSKGDYDTYSDFVDECFHRQLEECEKLEKKYFAEHDEYSLLKKQFRERKHNTTFGVNICQWSNGRITVAADDGSERDITVDELKDLIGKYERLDALIEQITQETHIVY